MSEVVPSPFFRNTGGAKPRRRTARLLTLTLICVGASPSEPGAQTAKCIDEIRAHSSARSIGASAWSLLDTLTPDPAVLAELDAQPEFRLPVWDYVAVMVDDERISDGRARLVEYKRTLDEIERRFGVEKELLVAIWGIESNFGSNRGGYDVLRSLLTLSCAGRRQTYFRSELRSALRIAEAGHVERARFTGSWAGAFGQTQFMPGTFLRLAVDFDGDGRRDLIGSAADALASAANYMRNAGWKRGAPWGIEVRLPGVARTPIDVRREGRRVRRTLATWTSRGVTRVDGRPLVSGALTPGTLAALVTPAGSDGPSFLVFSNFTAIYRYNASESYSLSVAHLADRLRGAGPIVTPWPTDDPGLSRAERRELQRLLSARGHPVGAASGVLTPATREAVRSEQSRIGHAVTGRPGQRLLAALRDGRTR
ncbi:MAG: lytic murein transglycosylase [Gemmatimonadota bacterium]